MQSDEAISLMIKNIEEWAKDSPKLIVTIEGIPGVGKSTIMDLMEGRINALLVHMDDFLTPIEQRQQLVDSGASVEKFVAGLFDFNDIKDLIKQYKDGEINEYRTLAYKSGKRQLEKTYDLTKPILIIEGTYLHHPDYFEDLWDKSIYLYGDEEEIKQRRIARTKKMMGENFISEDDPRSFFNLGLKAFRKYCAKYKLKENSDLTVPISDNV